MGSARLNNTTTPNTPPTGKTTLYIDEADKHTKQIDDAGLVTDLTISDGLTDQAFADKSGGLTEKTGIVQLANIVSLNADITKIDIIEIDCFIQGTFYNFPAQTAVLPTISAGESSTWLGFNGTAFVYQDDMHTDEETKTILPIARLQTAQGQTGPGSDLQLPLHITFAIGQEGHNERQWIENTIGTQYASGGTYSENTGVALQVDQANGVFYNSQRRRMQISTVANIEASRVYHIGGAPSVQNRATLIIPLFYDDGTDIFALPANKFTSHTLLRSPKEDDLMFLIYGTALYDSQAQAEEAPVDFSIFQSQGASLLYAVARFIVSGSSTNIEAIQDERPNLILNDESTGAGVLPPSSACLYISAPAPTTVSGTPGVFVKAAGTTLKATDPSSDFTLEGDNRFRFTGAVARKFKIDASISATSVGNAQEVRIRFAVNGTTDVSSEQKKVGVGTNIGTANPTTCVTLAENDYLELWLTNQLATNNITLDYMNMNIHSVD